MKKKLLTFAAIAAITQIQAQSSSTGTGMCPGGFTEDFSNTKNYSNPEGLGGLNWWEYDKGPFYTIARNPNNKTLDVKLNILAKRYEPMGVSFGDKTINGIKTKYTLDFTKDFSYELTIKNNTSTTIIVRLAAVDIAGRQLSLNGIPKSADAWKSGIEIKIESGQTGILGENSINSSGSENLGTFTNCSDVRWNNGVATILTDFDYTKVTGFNITVIDGINNPPKAVTGMIEIHHITIGNTSCLSNITTEIPFETTNNSSLSVFPNPVTNGTIYFNEVIEEIYVYDMLGQLVKTENNTNNVFVGTLRKGIYNLSTSMGNTVFIIP
ncbi:T9SS type A sorting domain-containing protein [Sporocytophaga myxococcoides]|uniref:T9SS type A sorting domain-containing protein n=1 Tax=Sporocytophaga myxococcoides TaxID=153721 RepID=UPI00040159C9|nr:T9SS type A sorting domain-containing protein [Sporocytophaga myxococcoides]